MNEKIRVAIVMTAQRLCAMKVEDDGRLETISLDGNESMKYSGESDFLEFADYIKKFYNVSELDDLDFSVVLLKAGVDAENAAQIRKIFEIVSDLYVLDAKDFESVFGEGANIFKANDAELDELKKEVGKLKDKNGKLKNENGKLNNENAELKNKLAETDKQLAETKKQLDVFLKKNRSRTICYMPKFENNDSTILGLFGDMKSSPTRTAMDEIAKFFTTVQNDNIQINYESKSDGSYIKKNQVIATIEIGTTKKEITAPRDGIVFYLQNDWMSVKGGEAFAIIGDENDTREDVMAWYNSQIAETKKQLDISLKKVEENQNRTRTICYVPNFAFGYGTNTYTLYNYQTDGIYITKDQVISTVEIGATKKEITASRYGKIFYLKNDWESVRGGEAFAIIGDKNDTREDVMAWYNSHK